MENQARNVYCMYLQKICQWSVAFYVPWQLHVFLCYNLFSKENNQPFTVVLYLDQLTGTHDRLLQW